MGRDDARGLDLQRRGRDHPQRDDRARHGRRRDRHQPRRADGHRRTFKDFHLQLKYRATATNNNGGVLLRGGEQVAILDNGTAATRTGAIVGLAPTTSAQAKPVREWNTLDVIAYGDGSPRA